jgi:hypothetical protein
MSAKDKQDNIPDDVRREDWNASSYGDTRNPYPAETKKPQRIQLQRRAGFNLQEASLVLNGLKAVNCARPSRFGNPYEVKRLGLKLAIELYARTIRGFWTPDGIPKSQIHAAYIRHQAFLKRHNHTPLENIRHELRGKNLACFCRLNEKCHCDILIEICNQ